MLATRGTTRNEIDFPPFGKTDGFVPLVGDSSKPVLSSEGRGWLNIGAMQFRFDEERIVAPPLPNHVVMLCLSNSLNVRAEIGKRSFEKRIRAGESSILPAGIESDWRVRAERGNNASDSGVLQMYLRPEFLRRIADSCEIKFNGTRLDASFCRADAQTRSVGLMLLEELKAENPLSRYRADLLAELLAVHLLSVHCSAAQKIEYKGGMPPGKLRRVTDYINEHFDAPLSLTELADTIEMNTFHFARQFKQATGQPPHQYIVSRRIERAKELLKTTKMPLVEISLEVGINSQNHFTTLFRRQTGLTPKQFRDRYS